MKRIYFFILLAYSQFCVNSVHAEDILTFGHFGKVTIYKPVETPTSVVLFVSGDGGWNKGVVYMAGEICKLGAMVAGIDITDYLKNLKLSKAECYYPASDFEQLSLLIQKKYKVAKYMKPILVGYSSGATLVYGLLAQAPDNTFKGAISLGFSPDLEINKPFCSGSGLKVHALKEEKSYYLDARENLSTPFIVLHGSKDAVCPFEATNEYIKKIKSAQLVELPKVGHGFSVAANWLPQFTDAFKKVLYTPTFTDQKNEKYKGVQTLPNGSIPDDMSLVYLPAAKKDTLPLAFFISGDGGWTSFDHSICENLSLKNIPVVGLDAQKYFWNPKTPEKAAEEISKVIEHYMNQWQRNNFILVGYSFGAGVIPFIADQLSETLSEHLKGVYCLSPSEQADFEIHITDMLNIDDTDEPYMVPKELKIIQDLNPVCIFGKEENAKTIEVFQATGTTLYFVQGNHHYNNNPEQVATAITEDVSKKTINTISSR